MWNLIKFLFTGEWQGHAHQWEEKETIDIYGENKSMVKAFLIVLRCKHCGDIKTKRIE